MERNGKEKSEEEPWNGCRILGATAGAVAVAAGAFFVLSRIGDSTGQDQMAAADDDDPSARPRRTMKGPGTGSESISRDRFEADPKAFFKTGRQKGTMAAVDAFK